MSWATFSKAGIVQNVPEGRGLCLLEETQTLSRTANPRSFVTFLSETFHPHGSEVKQMNVIIK